MAVVMFVATIADLTVLPNPPAVTGPFAVFAAPARARRTETRALLRHR